MIGCLPTLTLAFLAVCVYATHATQSEFVWMETGLKSHIAVSVDKSTKTITSSLLLLAYTMKTHSNLVSQAIAAASVE